jgi:hypothetical protein
VTTIGPPKAELGRGKFILLLWLGMVPRRQISAEIGLSVNLTSGCYRKTGHEHMPTI